MTGRPPTLWRRIGARTALVTSVVGMTMVLASVIFFFVEDDFRRILSVTAGLFFLLLAIWYASHPFLKEERHYPDLRRELDTFIDLTKELHYVAIEGDTEAFGSIEEKMSAQVTVVIETARKSEARHTAGVLE